MNVHNLDIYQITTGHFTFEKYVLEFEKVGKAAATKLSWEEIFINLAQM